MNKIKFFAVLFAAGLMSFVILNVRAGEPKNAASDIGKNPQIQQGTDKDKINEMKDILLKLVRQDELLDETIESMEDSSRLTVQDILAMSLSLRVVKNNVEHITYLTKKQFPEIQPSSMLAKYTRTISSYAGKLDRKTFYVESLASKLSGEKSSFRDAPSGSKRAKTRGKNMRNSASGAPGAVSYANGRQILEKQRALANLSENLKNLKSSSKKLKAASNWLYIASK
ncbi:MAG: hypothetical protein HY746_00580 [Elusimicrobia bacterium]|nr:hypothetical protein [Elusimicrobiota bacterium]